MMAVQRKEAYQAALREHGYEPVKEYEVDGHYTLEGGYSAMERLMQLKEPPRAVFCANDMSAIGALRYLSQNGYKVPQDMALVGYDDITVASLGDPGPDHGQAAGHGACEDWYADIVGAYGNERRGYIFPQICCIEV